MPRKRTTRARAMAKPSVTVVNAQTMSQQELKAREDQLQVIINDFRVKVAKDLKEMDMAQKNLERFIRRAFQDDITKLPQDIKKLTMKEYAMRLCEEEQAGTARPCQAIISKKDKLGEIQNFKWTNPSEGLDTLEEDEENTAQTPAIIKAKKGKKGKSTVKAPPSTRNKLQRPPSTRATRSRLYTPADRIGREQWGRTPLYTPRFDPSVPMTPANVREIRDGEVTVSIAGSPVGPKNRRDCGVSTLSPATVRRCTSIMEQETDIPMEDKWRRVFQLFTSALNQD